jgi:hypothetical protein
MARKRPPLFDGETYDEERDRARLSSQLNRVWAATADRLWHTLGGLSEILGEPEASISARLRDLRKERFGRYRVKRKYVQKGLFKYKVLPPLDDDGEPIETGPLPIRVRGRKTGY